ncbi:MAG: hypothetical protein WKF37_13775 [Bryobacteraceae bacterium]
MRGRNILILFAAVICVNLLSISADQAVARLFPRSFDDNGAVHHTGILVAMLLCRFLFFVLGGYAAARLTHRSALLFGIILLFDAAIALRWQLDYAPMWFHYANLGLLIPLALFGGWLGRRQAEIPMLKS